MGLLPGRDRKVVGIAAPSSRAKAQTWINTAMGRFSTNKRKFLGRK